MLSIALSLMLATASTPPTTPETAPAPAAASGDVPVPKKLQGPPSEETTPTVTIRSSENGDRIEEYRQAGMVYMVRVTPAHGKTYYLYDDDGNGRLDRTDADKNTVSPVYWTIYEWD